MIPLISLITSVKDYVEITHKVLEADWGTTASSFFSVKSYDDFGAILTFLVLSIKDFFIQFFTLSWLKNFWSLPIIVPDITSAMISEVSVLSPSTVSNSILTSTNGLNFLEAPVLGTQQNIALYSFEKFFIGFLNSIFLILPTSASHLITLRRFVMQGIDAGYYAGLGTIAGNILWFSSIIFGWRFFVIPWLSFDIFRYFFGFLLISKFLWDCTKEKKMTLEDLSKWKIFLLNFLLALTEQTCIFPFITNLSLSPEASLLETLSSNLTGQQSLGQFIFVHGAYLFGLFIGSFSLLQFCCWFWEYPAFSLYLWLGSKTNYQFTTRTSYKTLNFIFTYLTMLFAISSIPYYGLEYTLTNPLGFVPQDRLLTQKPSIQSQSDYERMLPETSFLGVKATNSNMRVRDGQRARRERWKQQFIKYQSFDASVYDQNVYDFLTIEDLNYGFDRFWFRRKMRNHYTHFRLFPGPWMRSLKKQLVRPNREGRGTEFFTLLFEQYYHPNFHKINKDNVEKVSKNVQTSKGNLGGFRNTGFVGSNSTVALAAAQSVNLKNATTNSITRFAFSPTNTTNINYLVEKKASAKISALRKFVRNFNTRVKTQQLLADCTECTKINNKFLSSSTVSETKPVYSKRWKHFYSKFWRGNITSTKNPFRIFSKNVFFNTANVQAPTALFNKKQKQLNILDKGYLSKSEYSDNPVIGLGGLIEPTFNSTLVNHLQNENYKLTQAREKLSKKDRQILRYRSAFSQQEANNPLTMKFKAQTMFHPLKFYLQKEEAFRRKLKFYGSTVFRKFSIGNNSPYLRTIMKRGFFYYKPSLRLKRTANVAALRRGFRKKSRMYKKRINNFSTEPSLLSNAPLDNSINPPSTELITRPTHFYSATGKRASRYRAQIYKDVLQHWYYTPFNRLLLKFDIDAFINRQPRAHFLTTNEEQLLHLRRFLLADHYDSLRWYSFIQNYRSMKTRIGGAKSFASRAYNQQFQGTFKKIRHLFAITPIQTNQNGPNLTGITKETKEKPTILKYDQPLFNEYNNTKSFKVGVNIHEELLLPTLVPLGLNDLDVMKQTDKIDLISTSTNLVGKYLIQSQPIRQEYIKTLINQNNYAELMKFMTTSNTIMLDKQQIQQSSTANNSTNNVVEQPIKKQFWFQFLKQSKRRINNQKFLKKYLNHRISKREKRTLQKQKTLKTRLKRLQTWLTPAVLKNNISPSLFINPQNSEETYIKSPTIQTTGLDKAIKNSLTVSLTNQSNLYIADENIKSLSGVTNDQILPRNSLLNILTTEKQINQSLNSLKVILETNTEKQQETKIKSSLYTILSKTKKFLISFKNSFVEKSKPMYFFLKQRDSKTLDLWKKRQKVKAKTQQQRKKLETTISTSDTSNLNQNIFVNIDRASPLINKTTISDINLNNTQQLLRYKRVETDFNNEQKAIQKFKQTADKLSFLKQTTGDDFSRKPFFVKNLWQKFFIKKFNKKMSKKGKRSYFYPQTLQTLLKFEKPKLINKRTIKSLSKDKKQRILRKGGILSYVQSLEETSNFTKTEQAELKDFDFAWSKTNTSKINQSKKRKRRKAKRKYPTFKNRLRKYTKRRIFRKGKIKTFAKQLKKLEATLELQLWWWQKYIPKIQMQAQLTQQPTNQANSLDFKPLNVLLNNQNVFKQISKESLSLKRNAISNPNSSNTVVSEKKENQSINPLTKIYEQLYLKPIPSNSDSEFSKFIGKETVLNPFPFYAGWDNSLRKFVLTNRFLTRRDTALKVNNLGLQTTEVGSPMSTSQTFSENSRVQSQQIFTNNPVLGLNEANFLYWQNEMPFKSFNIEQFNTNVTSFYAPIGWRRFQFRHSILKTWLNNGEIRQQQQQGSNLKQNGNIIKIKLNSELTLNNLLKNIQYKQKRKTQKFEYRRLTKRYKLSKNAPASFTFKPPGPVLMDVLPSHYLAVFNSQYRLPRHRYLKYKLLKNSKIMQEKNNQFKQINNLKQQDPLSSTAEFNKDFLFNSSKNITAPSFTLRKRIKPKRKFHRKRVIKAGGLIVPRRRQFINTTNTSDLTNLRWRPSTDYNKNKIDSQKTRLKTDTIRRRKLRRKVFKQIFKPTQRFQPRYGGFIWPGDYPRLEFTDMPKLTQTKLVDSGEKIQPQQKTKEKRKISPMVGVLPHTSLVEKHNLLVLKKKLEKAQRSNKINQKKEEFKLMYKIS